MCAVVVTRGPFRAFGSARFGDKASALGQALRKPDCKEAVFVFHATAEPAGNLGGRRCRLPVQVREGNSPKGQTKEADAGGDTSSCPACHACSDLQAPTRADTMLCALGPGSPDMPPWALSPPSEVCSSGITWITQTFNKTHVCLHRVVWLMHKVIAGSASKSNNRLGEMQGVNGKERTGGGST